MSNASDLAVRLRNKLISEGIVFGLPFPLVDQLREIGGLEAARAIAEHLSLSDDEIQSHVGYALYLLGEHGQTACREALQSPDLAEGAITWLLRCGDEAGKEAAKEALLRLLMSPDVRLRYVAQKYLVHLGEWKPLIRGLSDEDATVRLDVAEAFGPRRWTEIHPRLRWVRYGNGAGAIPPPPGAITPPDEKDDGWIQMAGVGDWDAFFVLENAASQETNPKVLKALKRSLAKLILVYCPSDQAPAYIKRVGQAFLDEGSEAGSRFSGSWAIIDWYIQFCQRGGLPLHEPLRSALGGGDGVQHRNAVEHLLAGLRQVEDKVHDYDSIRIALVEALEKEGSTWAVEVLIAEFQLSHRGSLLEQHCAEAIIRMEGREAAIPELLKSLDSERSRALLILIGPAAVAPLLSMLDSSTTDEQTKLFAIQVLTRQHNQRVMELLASMSDEPTKLLAMQVLNSPHDQRVVDLLASMTRFWNSTPRRVKEAARFALKQLGERPSNLGSTS